MGKDKRIVVISDTQCPYEDTRALKAVIRFIGEYQPDEVIHIGDVVDYPQPSRWTKGTRQEFEGSVFADSEYTIKNLIQPLREAYGGEIGFHEGNHDERPRVYLDKYAPALSGPAYFNFEHLLEFENYEIRRLPEFNKVAPGWITTHGHRGGISLSRIAGNTALNAARKLDSNLVMGHTHRLGIGSESRGRGGVITSRVTGMEVGNLMDQKKAGYLRGGSANWQSGFGIIQVSGPHVQATPISINGKKFTVDGVVYHV
ncbi:metallophosphoesterase [Saccharopolyspora indica]|uniref:metallophosphoesterase n=1 Tax=Saccharopolyspora indica TaxID=1229659 RepID=UPI0022EB2024|nr:metallophosphoesterase [Saccharopolyspora indica]MDA3643814.1 metallophosphoesterase [Saccharopolyspora indica]